MVPDRLEPKLAKMSNAILRQYAIKCASFVGDDNYIDACRA